MGGDPWRTSTYDAANAYRAANNIPAFGHTANINTGAAPVGAHATLDPKGVKVREAHDSDKQPQSLPIAVLFDVTGSMGGIPVVMQTKLGQLFGLLLRKGYVEDPQILFGAIGDSRTDNVPLQIGQFESDNKADEQLRNIYLEGNGGGQMHEGYEMAFYFMARHTDLDSVNKRGKKGYLFIIGDEKSYDVDPATVRKILGPDAITEPVSIAAIIAEAAEKFEIYFIFPREGSSYSHDDEVPNFWRKLLGERLLMLDDNAAVCETIALTIGLNEGTIDLAQGLQDLSAVGSTAGAAVGKALATIGASKGIVSKSPVPVGVAAGVDSVARV